MLRRHRHVAMPAGARTARLCRQKCPRKTCSHVTAHCTRQPWHITHLAVCIATDCRLARCMAHGAWLANNPQLMPVNPTAITPHGASARGLVWGSSPPCPSPLIPSNCRHMSYSTLAASPPTAASNLWCCQKSPRLCRDHDQSVFQGLAAFKRPGSAVLGV